MRVRQPKNLRLNNFSDFYCVNCGKKGIPIVRREGKHRELGHLKKLYCFYCNSEQNMVEIISGSRYTLEDFLIEFNNGNFVNGQRVKPYKQFIAEIKQKELKINE